MEPFSNFLSRLSNHQKATPPSRVTVQSASFDSSSPSGSSPSCTGTTSPAVNGLSSGEPQQPGALRIASLNSDGKGGGPAFVGQVFSMCDLYGTGLMAVSTHFSVPFLSKRAPEWLKKIFTSVIKSERNGPVFRFFMDLGDAVSYVKQINVPSGVVGACRLDLAYEHFKEKPHLFQFIPNERQVKEANYLLKKISPKGRRKRIDGVPVFSAENLDIAIATTDGIKWYTPYFFDKNMLDNILEESVDQHFKTLIQSRHIQRRRDVLEDSLASEAMEDLGDTLIEPPEVQEVLDEVGHPVVPLSVISKAAEIQLLYAVDKLLLGNKWLRKSTGIQPKYPYMVDSFERRSAFSSQRNSGIECFTGDCESRQLSELHEPRMNLWNPIETLFKNFGWKQVDNALSSRRDEDSGERHTNRKADSSVLLPKITMVGISTGETGGQVTKAGLKKAMEDLTRELENSDHRTGPSATENDESVVKDRDPLFVANVGDYQSGLSKMGSARWMHERKK